MFRVKISFICLQEIKNESEKKVELNLKNGLNDVDKYLNELKSAIKCQTEELNEKNRLV